MYSVIALAGPQHLIDTATVNLGSTYHKVFKVHTPRDCGEFPDMQGYESKDFREIELDSEDPHLHQYIIKCVDMVVDALEKRESVLEKLGVPDIESVVNGLNQGGPLFVIAGFVKHKGLSS